jgi:RimJ/RimL family protein N-acetyltransferase
VAPSQQARIELVTPFPREFYKQLHRWFIQYPDKMMDDTWPKDFDAVCQAIDARSETEYTCMVTENGTPAGFIGYQQLTPHVGSLRGVCFDKKVHGNGTALRALRAVLQQQFDNGTYKIMAFPYVDNPRSHRFYQKLGAQDEGILRKHTLRGGEMVDMHLMAFFAPDDGYLSPHHGYSLNKVDSHAA